MGRTACCDGTRGSDARSWDLMVFSFPAAASWFTSCSGRWRICYLFVWGAKQVIYPLYTWWVRRCTGNGAFRETSKPSRIKLPKFSLLFQSKTLKDLFSQGKGSHGVWVHDACGSTWPCLAALCRAVQQGKHACIIGIEAVRAHRIVSVHSVW